MGVVFYYWVFVVVLYVFGVYGVYVDLVYGFVFFDDVIQGFLVFQYVWVVFFIFDLFLIDVMGNGYSENGGVGSFFKGIRMIEDIVVKVGYRVLYFDQFVYMIMVNFQDVFVFQMVFGQVEQNFCSCLYVLVIGMGLVGEFDFGVFGVLCVYVEVYFWVVYLFVEVQYLIGGIVEIQLLFFGFFGK